MVTAQSKDTRTVEAEAARSSISLGKAGFQSAWLVLALAAFQFFFRLGNFGVIDGSESYYPAAVREMVEAHSYIVPQMNYQIYFSKPIMTFWLLASAYHLFGVNEFAGRFFGAVLGIALTMTIYAVTRAIAGVRAGLIASVLFCGSPFVLEYFRISSVDAYFTSFLGLAFCALLMVLSAGTVRWWPMLYLSLGLAVLTKGPAALVLFLSGLVIALVAARPSLPSLKYWLRNLHVPEGTAIFALIVVPWYCAVGIATKWLFLKVFFIYENLGRASGHTNLRAWYWWRFIAVIGAGLFPWSLLLPAVYHKTFATVRKRFENRPVPSSRQTVEVRGLPEEPGDTTSKLAEVGGPAEEPGDANSKPPLDATVVCVCSALAIILLFTISKTQMEPYVLPAVAPLSIATALLIEKSSRSVGAGFARWCLEKFSSFMSLLAPFLCLALIAASALLKDSDVPSWARIAVPMAACVFATVSLYQRKLANTHDLSRAILASLAAFALFSSVTVAGALEYWYNKKFSALHYLCSILRQTEGEIGLFENYRPSVFYYVRRPVNCFYQTKWLHKRQGSYVYILSRISDAGRITDETHIPLTVIQARGEWAIYLAENSYLQPYATLAQTFSTLSVTDILTDRMHLGVLTDCLSGGPLWKGN